jgi:HAD superfamily hydrolase (TIGR01549 family)
VQLCDYRNYCHGRFIFGSNHCANKKVKKTDVCTILLISPREEFLAQKVRELVLPANMPIVEIRTEHDNPLASVQLLIDSLTFVSDLAEKQLGINPNSPPNYSSINKQVPIYGINFIRELSSFGELHYGDVKPKPLAKKSEKVRDTTRYELVTILDGMPFKPYEEFNIPVRDCIQFHSEALPENQILSNHYDCIIRFRDCEFYSLEQMFLGLTYSESPEILREIMNCKSGIRAKGLCRKKYENDRDWDFEQKQYRIIALCHLYKYLSVKEYRDRLRETYPQTLVECPNGTDYEFGLVQNLETNIFEGNNCSGRTTMIVRDMMLKLETEAIQKKEAELGRALTEEEREVVVEDVCARVRAKYDSDEVVLKDSQKLFDFIESENIPKIKKRRPKKFVPPEIDRSHRCLVLDFDFTIFDTSVDDPYRKVEHNRDLEKAQELIPEYKLYDGWREVFEWCKKNDIKIGVISEASRELIVEKAFKHFDIPFDYVVGARPYIGKPNPILGNILMRKLNIREEQMVYVGDSLDDEIQARSSKLLFYGATWHNPKEEPFTAKGVQTISDPREIIKILENITIGE